MVVVSIGKTDEGWAPTLCWAGEVDGVLTWERVRQHGDAFPTYELAVEMAQLIATQMSEPPMEFREPPSREGIREGTPVEP